ncbi:transposase [Flavivirga aquimarina]|uniref:Transposase n=1 Tax=Flavivirga aquimarina TaxID=2027862 RepID=A0ABT8W7Q0_9FLAO|nr:transposase [Flavivirga aquimarina]MDO5969121.1 transposase [Flavivirga aquimarina]
MKLQRFSDFQHSFSFLSATENMHAYYTRFLESDLGKIHLAIPWESLVEDLQIKEKTAGSKMVFSPKGRLALMFLKHYACCSDRKLIEQLNSNIDYQFFCDIHLGLIRLTNFKIVSQIRCELADKLNIDLLEKTLYHHWQPYIDNKSQVTVDATCYESELRYPTPTKLLWEAVDWLYNQLRDTCKYLGIKMLRTKYIKWKKRYFGFSKMRRKTNKKRRPLIRALLGLLHKLIGFEAVLRNSHKVKFTVTYYRRVATIKKVHQQQKVYFETGKPPKNRIVSVAKDYLRPIVRGKEVKPVEFGAKVNKLQIDGINFIEHLSFNAFNEGTRLKSSIYKAQSLTKVKTKVLGADAIYATNKNRTFVTKNNIKTDFKRKGKLPENYKDEKKLKALITKERATRLEGSFGKEKEHYHLKRIKAKTKATEKLWICFGIHTANALEIGRRIQNSLTQIAA